MGQRITFTVSGAPYYTVYYSGYDSGPWSYLTGPANFPIYYLVPSDWSGKKIYFKALYAGEYSGVVSIQVAGASGSLNLSVSPSKVPALQATEITVTVKPVDAMITILGPGVFRQERSVNGVYKTTIYPANSASGITVKAEAQGYITATTTIAVTMAPCRLTVYVYGADGPIQGASVSVSGPSSGSGSTDASGNFSMNASEGDYKAKASASGYQAGEKSFTIMPEHSSFTASIGLARALVPPSLPSAGEALGEAISGAAAGVSTWFWIIVAVIGLIVVLMIASR